MKNEMVLDGYGVVEMRETEKLETDGGILPFLLFGAALICEAVAWDMCMNYKSACAAVNKGYNETRNH